MRTNLKTIVKYVAITFGALMLGNIVGALLHKAVNRASSAA